MHPAWHSVQEVRLLALLGNLVKQRARTETAEDPGVNYENLAGDLGIRPADPAGGGVVGEAAHGERCGRTARGPGGHDVPWRSG